MPETKNKGVFQVFLLFWLIFSCVTWCFIAVVHQAKVKRLGQYTKLYPFRTWRKTAD
jgi:hypothetical protein